MPLELLTPYWPVATVAAGVFLLVWGQRDRLRALAGRVWPGDTEDGDAPADGELTEVSAHEAYACLRLLLEEVEDCPKATEALQFVVLPALVRGADAPHYRVTWETKP